MICFSNCSFSKVSLILVSPKIKKRVKVFLNTFLFFYEIGFYIMPPIPPIPPICGGIELMFSS